MGPEASAMNGRVALVTGGNRGIGAAIARALAADGADVAINYRRDEDSARETAQAIGSLGRRVELYQASVDDVEADSRLVEAVMGDFGGIDILVHCAGIASRGQSVVDTDPEEIERVWRVHALSAFALSKLIVPPSAALVGAPTMATVGSTLPTFTLVCTVSLSPSLSVTVNVTI